MSFCNYYYHRDHHQNCKFSGPLNILYYRKIIMNINVIHVCAINNDVKFYSVNRTILYEDR